MCSEVTVWAGVRVSVGCKANPSNVRGWNGKEAVDARGGSSIAERAGGGGGGGFSGKKC